MRKLISFMHVSLDGFVADANGDLRWVKLDDELFDFVATMTANSDMALYGRKTFEMMEGYWHTAGDKPTATKHDKEHSRWYKAVNKAVLSRTMKTADASTVIISNNVPERLKQLKLSSDKDLLMFGSPSATHSLMWDDLIDGYRLFVNPILLGSGTPMFKGLQSQHSLKLISTKAFSSGVVMMHFEREREN